MLRMEYAEEEDEDDGSEVATDEMGEAGRLVLLAWPKSCEGEEAAMAFSSSGSIAPLPLLPSIVHPTGTLGTVDCSGS